MTLIQLKILNKYVKNTPLISIVIPTLNESKTLPLILSDLSEISDICEILIIDSKSIDKTEDIAFIHGCKFRKLDIKNRGLQLNYGAKISSGIWLLFIHADSRLKSGWSKEIRQIIKNNSELIYYFNFSIDNKKFIFRLLEFLVNLRCLFFKTPYGDQGLFINKNNYFKKNGFKEIPIMEDIDFIKRIDKKFLISLRTSILTNSRKWDNKNIIKQSFNNWSLRKEWINDVDIEYLYSKYYKK